MFRLISLNINDWNYLGHFPEGKLVFLPDKEIKITNLPYSTVLIGPNGTGKSTLLSYIAKIFEDLKYIKDSGKRNPKGINFPYSICYLVGKNKFQISHKNDGLDIASFNKDLRVLKWNYMK
jgi:ABC-type enterochelin transport system ATPase subunit